MITRSALDKADTYSETFTSPEYVEKIEKFNFTDTMLCSDLFISKAKQLATITTLIIYKSLS